MSEPIRLHPASRPPARSLARPAWLDGRTVEAAVLLVGLAAALALSAADALYLGLALLAWSTVRLASRRPGLPAFDAAALGLALAGVVAYALGPTVPGAARLVGLAVALAGYLAASEVILAGRIRRPDVWLVGLLLAGIGLEVFLLRGAYPPQPLTPDRITALLVRLPDLRTDPLDMNARLVIHAYGIAQFALVGLALCLAWAFRPRPWRERGLPVALVLLFGLLLALSQSRSALLAAAVVLPIVGGFRSWRWWLALPAGALGVYLVNVTELLGRGLDTDWFSLRWYAWRGALHLILERPLTGLGLGMRTVAERFQAHFALDDPHTISHAHNIFLQAYLEAGPLGFAALAVLLLAGIWTAVRTARSAADPAARWAAAGVAAALAGSAVFGLTDAVPTSDIGLLLLLLLGALLLPAAAGQAAAPPHLAWVRRGLLAGIALTLAVLALAWPLTLAKAQVNRAAWLLSADNPTPGQAAAAVDAAGVAVRLRPGDPVGYRYEAWSRLAAGDVAGALDAAAAERAMPSLSGYEQFQLGRIYEAVGQTADVVPLWIEAGEGWRLSTLASDYVEHRHLAQAEQIYRGLVAYDPNDANALGELGVVILRRRGDADEAIGFLLRSAALDPDKSGSLGNYILERGVDRRDDAEQSRGDYTDALNWLRAAAALRADKADAQLELGRAWALDGQADAARAAFRRALQLDPNNADARAALQRLPG